MIRVILQVFCGFFSGLLEGLSISNEVLLYGSPILALFSLAPLYVALYSSKSYKESALIVALQVFTVHMISSFWLANFRGYAFLTLGSSAFGTTLEAWLCGFFFYVIQSRMSKNYTLEENSGLHPLAPFARIMYFSACWLFYEWIKSVGFLGYPWGTLPAAAYKFHILTQIVDITGVWGITFLFAMFSGLVGETYFLLKRIATSPVPKKAIQPLKQCAIFVFTFFGLSFLYGVIQYNLPRTPDKQLEAILVQQNIDPWEGGDKASIEISKKLTEAKVSEMKEQGLQPDLIVWSEGVLERVFPNAAAYYSRNPKEESLSEFISRMDVPFIIGGTTVENRKKQHYNNSAILYDANGSYAGFYSKIHLVPFAEGNPFQDNPLVMEIAKSMGLGASLSSGKQIVLFRVPLKEEAYTQTPFEYRNDPNMEITLNKFGYADEDTIKYFTTNEGFNPDAYVSFTTPICFEDSFNDVCSKLYAAGSEVFINITNDSWSKTRSSEIQHFIEASYRSIEYRTTLVRCANSGYTVVVNPAGKIVADLPLFTEDALGISIPIYERQHTIYSICGDWFVRTVVILLMLYVVIVGIRLHKEGHEPSNRRFKRIVIKFEYVKTEPQVSEVSSPADFDTSAEPLESEKKDASENPTAVITLAEPVAEPFSKETKPTATKKTAARKTTKTVKAEKKTTSKAAAPKKTATAEKKTVTKKATASTKKATATSSAKTAATKKTTTVKKPTAAKSTKKPAEKKTSGAKKSK